MDAAVCVTLRQDLLARRTGVAARRRTLRAEDTAAKTVGATSHCASVALATRVLLNEQ